MASQINPETCRIVQLANARMSAAMGVRSCSVRDPQRGRANRRRGCISAPSGCQGDTVARSEAIQVSKVPRLVVSGQPRVRIIKWARLYSGRECLGAYLQGASVCS